MADFSNAIQEYVRVQSGGAVTYPTGGTWLSAYCLHLGVTTPVGGSWLIALCNHFGITAPLNGSWVIALANYYGITSPSPYGTWWMALAHAAVPAIGCQWGSATATFGQDTRVWSSTAGCTVPPPPPTPTPTPLPAVNWEANADNWEVETQNWETV